MKSSTIIRSFLFMFAVLLAIPGFGQSDRERPNTARGQLGLTRRPRLSDERTPIPRDRVFFNYEYFATTDQREGGDDATAPMDEESRRRFNRIVGGFVRKFLDQWKRYDELNRQIDAERAKPRAQRNRAQLRQWESELDDIKKENAEQRRRLGFTTDAVKNEVEKQIKDAKVNEAQEAENEKARAEGRQPRTITNVPTPHGNPPVLE